MKQDPLLSIDFEVVYNEHTAILLIHRYEFPDASFSLTTLSQEIVLKAEKLPQKL